MLNSPHYFGYRPPPYYQLIIFIENVFAQTSKLFNYKKLTCKFNFLKTKSACDIVPSLVTKKTSTRSFFVNASLLSVKLTGVQ